MKFLREALLLATLLLGAGLLAGCGQTRSATANVGEQTKPAAGKIEEKLFERIRAGTIQLDLSVKELERVRDDLFDAAKAARGSSKEGLQEVVDLVDDAGATLSELELAEPVEGEYLKDRKKELDRITKLSQGAEDASIALHNAQGILFSLNGKRNADRLATIAGDLEEAAEAIRGTSR